MSIRTRIATCIHRSALAAIVAAFCLLTIDRAQGQFINQQVGGVSIDAKGLVSKVRLDELNELKREREQAFQAVPSELQAKGMRKISLRQLEAAIVEHNRKGTQLPDDIRYLAGMQRIQYVFVYPEQNDIVIAGPAEGWKLDAMGEVVGVTTNRPVLLLDDLLIALRSIEGAQSTGILCSIDPTAEGIARFDTLRKRLVNPGVNIDPVLDELENAMGQQIITVKGVPDSSHFARVLVAADYRMKRLAMGFEQSPVPKLSNFLKMVNGKKQRSAMPRWWLEPEYDAIVTDSEGLAYELRGGSVKAMTEEEFIDSQGQRRTTGKADPTAKKWADQMTACYDDLAAKDSIFGQLRNCIDLAVLAALITHQGLPEKAGWKMTELMSADIPVQSFHAPHQVDSQASGLLKGGDWVLSVSGGVMINPWKPLTKPTTSEELTAVRGKAVGTGTSWWWN